MSGAGAVLGSLALLGIVVLAAGVPSSGVDALSWQALATFSLGRETALVAYILLLVGLVALNIAALRWGVDSRDGCDWGSHQR